MANIAALPDPSLAHPRPSKSLIINSLKSNSRLSPEFLSTSLGWRQEASPETLLTGIESFDRTLAGFPRGRISEITGPASSGRTTLLHSLLAAATGKGEHCVLIDACDTFDPPSAAARGVSLDRLIWIRCGGNAEHAMRSADLLLNGGGFGVVALDLAGVSPAALRRIPLTAWFRFRRAVEPTFTVFAVLADRSLVRSCGSLMLETRRRALRYLKVVRYEAVSRREVRKEAAEFDVRLHSLAG